MHDAVETVLKGYEAAAEPFRDSDGVTRSKQRVCWWLDPSYRERSAFTVFGHYWNVPAHVAPPHPSGHPSMRRWQRAATAELEASGRLREGRQAVPETECSACVDFNGANAVGAFRWPERELVWVA